jgi:uncharacterized protein
MDEADRMRADGCEALRASMIIDQSFSPPRYLRNPMVQTILNSSSLRTLGKNPMADAAEELVLELAGGVRLQGFLSRQQGREVKGLVILFHGWEGSARSAYMLHTGKFLFHNGFDVFRLNFRDHGETHHLNDGLFMGTLFDEVYQAVKAVASMTAGMPVFVAGFSMGANFAVRVAARFGEDPIGNLKGVLAINPPLDPQKATVNIDRIGFVKSYFIKKWKQSLKKKQELFPGLYDFSDILAMKTCMEMTEALIPRLSGYAGAAEYFRGYTLTGELFDRVEAPLTVITAADDPIIPVEDFSRIAPKAAITLIVQKYGGHCGYIEGCSLNSWYQKIMLDLFC